MPTLAYTPYTRAAQLAAITNGSPVAVNNTFINNSAASAAVTHSASSLHHEFPSSSFFHFTFY